MRVDLKVRSKSGQMHHGQKPLARQFGGSRKKKKAIACETNDQQAARQRVDSASLLGADVGKQEGTCWSLTGKR